MTPPASKVVNNPRAKHGFRGRTCSITSERDGNLRISAHCYNTLEDVDTVLASLRRHSHLVA